MKKINFGIAIKLMRIMRDLKARDLAKSMGISFNYLSNIENNKCYPSLSLLIKIANKFKIPLSLIVLEAEKLGGDIR